MLHDIEEEARIKQILEVLDKSLQVSLKIDEVVGRLSEKRVTLEEKMIRSYFHLVGANLLELGAWLNRALAAAITPKSGAGGAAEQDRDGNVTVLSTDQIKLACADCEQLLGRLEPEIDQLLKALRYDLNYVEQYFEFNYYGKLTNEDSYLADSVAVLKKFKAMLEIKGQ